MIAAVGLAGFKTHESTSLQFGRGTNVLVGVMGSGKSTVMEALCFGLYGTFPALKSHKLSLSDVIRGFGEEGRQDGASVRVDFQVEGENYSVDRRISGDGSEAFLRKEGALLEGPQPQRVTERVAELLDMDYDTFVRTAYCEQNRIDHFLLVGKGDRKRQLDGLLGLERLEAARQGLSAACNRLAVEANALRAAAATSEQVAEAEGLLAAAEQSAAFFEARVAEVSEAEEACRKALAQKNAEVGAARFAREKIARAQAEVQKAEAVLSALAAEEAQRRGRIAHLSESTGARDAEQAGRELLQSNGKIRALESALVDAAARQAEASQASGRRARASAELEEARAALFAALARAGAQNEDALGGMLRQAAAKKAEFQQKAAQQRALLLSARKALDSLGGAQAQCPVCEKPLEKGEQEELCSRKEEEIRHCEAEEAAAAALFSSEDARERELRSMSEKAAAASQKIPALLSECAQLAAAAGRAEEADGMVASVREELVQERQRNAELYRATQLAAALFAERDALGAALEKAARAQGERDAQARSLESFRAEGVYVDEEGHARLEAEREALMKRAFELSAEKEKAFSQSQIRRNEAAAIRKNLQDARARIARADALSQKASRARAMQNALVEVQESLRTRLIGAVNQALSAAWSRLYPYNDYSSARLSPLSDDYSLELCTAGGEWIAAERASGGERSIASLALRMAFARVLAPKLDVLILDEPTHNLDAAGIGALSAALREASAGPGGFSQVFVITHEDGLREAADDSALYEFSRSKKDSGDPTQVKAGPEGGGALS
jgi:exonuclease SbcC